MISARIGLHVGGRDRQAGEAGGADQHGTDQRGCRTLGWGQTPRQSALRMRTHPIAAPSLLQIHVIVKKISSLIGKQLDEPPT